MDTHYGFSKFIMNSNCDLNNSGLWQELTDQQQALIQAGAIDADERINVQFSFDKIDISIMNKSSPGGAGINEIRWDDRAGINW